jgi:hypothetical protein
MEVFVMFTRLWCIAGFGLLGVLFWVMQIGCGGDKSLVEIEVPTRIEGGATVQATVKPIKGFPDDAQYIFSGDGVDVSQVSLWELVATITAPNHPGPSDIRATVTCEVQHDGEVLGRGTVTLKITPGGTDVAATKPTPPVGKPTEPKPTPPPRKPSASPSGPQVLITEVPAAGPGGPAPPSEWMSGEVSGVTPEDCRIVVYAYTDRWYVQPYIRPEPGLGAPDGPLTRIESDGTWNTPTRSGSKYAALLVKDSYKPRSTLFALPTVGGNVLSVASVKGR